MLLIKQVCSLSFLDLFLWNAFMNPSAHISLTCIRNTAEAHIRELLFSTDPGQTVPVALFELCVRL